MNQTDIRRSPQIVCEVPNCLELIAEQLPVSKESAVAMLRVLIKNGYAVVPIEPTNAMFVAYISALNNPAVLPSSLVANVGKARKRWKAMVLAGMKVAFSHMPR